MKSRIALFVPLLSALAFAAPALAQPATPTHPPEGLPPPPPPQPAAQPAPYPQPLPPGYSPYGQPPPGYSPYGQPPPGYYPYGQQPPPGYYPYRPQPVVVPQPMRAPPRRAKSSGVGQIVGGSFMAAGGAGLLLAGMSAYESANNVIPVYCRSQPGVPCRRRDDSGGMAGATLLFVSGGLLALGGTALVIIGIKNAASSGSDDARAHGPATATLLLGPTGGSLRATF